MEKIYKEIVKACQYCPKRVGGWSETHCLALKPSKVIKGMYFKGFPKWCPLENYNSGSK